MASSDKSKSNVLIINCDGTYPLDSVNELVQESSKATGVVTTIELIQLALPNLAEVSEEVKGKQLLCAILVLNAHESRLSINEKNAGIGYAVLYRALRKASKGRVLVVIGADEKSSAADRKVVSNWVRYKVASQFEEEYLDGRRGFVFSWGKTYHPVHEDAFQQYLRAIDSDNKGLDKPFSPAPIQRPPKDQAVSKQPTKQLEEQGEASPPMTSAVSQTNSEPSYTSPDGSNTGIPAESTHTPTPTNSTDNCVTEPNTQPPSDTKEKFTRPQGQKPSKAPRQKPRKGKASKKEDTEDRTKERLESRVDELKQKYPKGKFLGVIRYGVLAEKYAYPLEESAEYFSVPKYMINTFYEEKKDIPEIDVIIYEHPEEGDLQFSYLDPPKVSNFSRSNSFLSSFYRKNKRH